VRKVQSPAPSAAVGAVLCRSKWSRAHFTGYWVR
jgi:hypothetical protein